MFIFDCAGENQSADKNMFSRKYSIHAQIKQH